MNKYPKYKPSGVEWIGEIPNEWEVKKTKYCFKYTTGFTPPTGQNEYYNGEHIWITISDMNQKQLFDSSIKLSDEAIEKYQPEIAPKGSLLFSFKLSVGKVSFAGTNLYTNEAIISIIPNENVNLNYFFYVLPDQLLRNANENIYGAKLLNQELIRNASLIFPPSNVQTAIANYLDAKTGKIDTLIEKKKKLIVLLKEERTAVINHAVTHGINPSVNLKDSGIEWLGQIPEHWEVKKLKYVAKINSESLTENEDEDLLIHYIDISSVNSDGNIISTTEYLYSDAPSRARRIVNEGDTILSTVRTYLKAIAYIEEANNNLTCSTGFAVIRPSDVFIPNFLFYIFRSQIIIEKIMANSKGVSYPAIDSEDVKLIPIWYPDKEEQLQIVQHIETETKRIDGTISKIEKEIELLSEFRTALISEVVTGKIKV
ncbi:MAG: restriction endonuclease subunit S [Ignavibacterium sp.]